MSKRKATAVPVLPPSHLEAMQRAGFEAVRYLNASLAVITSDGQEREEWIPEDMVCWERRLSVRYRTATEGNYDFAGWEPQACHCNGGRYRTVQSALAWFDWLAKQKERSI
jgi:hypothetical protein